ncbi:hypothetical protein FACS189475_04560 [Betaproteobacteria bacterium]|nr:hypothetical protein FACS189475_04560 [Betaproteobacteria bacterium]
MPRRKGTPKTGGRKPGSKNCATKDIRELAQPYGAEAVTVLAGLMKDEAQPPETRIRAAQTLLDRGYGKPIEYREQTILENRNSFRDLSDDELAQELEKYGIKKP